MIEKNKIGIVKLTTKTNSTIKLAAMVPQRESFDEDNFQIPPGFNLIVLPYSDEIQQQIPFENPPRDTDSGKLTMAKLLINTFTSEIDCRNFENPGIQNFYTKLQSFALEEDSSDPINDLLLPDSEGMQKYTSLLDNFKSTFNLSDLDNIPKKRGKPKKDTNPPKNGPKPKRVSVLTDLDLEDIDFQEEKTSKSKTKSKPDIKLIENLIANGEVHKVTVIQLKAFIESKGFKPTGNKEKLFEQAQMAMIPN